MNASRLRVGTRALRSYPRAKISAGTVVLLVVLRCYAIAAIGVAIYAFVRALS